MKFTANRAAFLAALQTVAGGCATRTTKPVLQCVLVRAQDGALTLTAYDLEAGLRHTLRGVEVARAGACLLPPQTVIDILRTSDGDSVSVSAAGVITVSVAGARFEMPVQEVNEFPAWPAGGDGDGALAHELGGEAVRRLLRHTAFAAERKDLDTKFRVNAVLWERLAGEVRVTGTDTRRCAVDREAVPGDGGVTGTVQHLIPVRACQLVERATADAPGPVRVELRPTDARFVAGDTEVYTALANGRFPPGARFCADARDAARHRIELGADAFGLAVRRAAIMTDASSQRVELAFAAGEVVMAAQGEAVGESEVRLAVPFAGEPVKLAIDPKYVLDFLKAVGPDATVVLHLQDGTKPVLFTCGDSYEYLVMPLATVEG